MARYFLRFRHSDTGLTPTFTFFKKASDLTNQTAPPISELGSGTYYFDFTPTFDIVFEADGGASIPTEEVRYISDTISPKDTYVDEPTSQVKDDVWNDATNRAPGTKGDFVEHIGIDTDAVDAATVFGKVYKARDAIMGGTGFGGTGVDVKSTYDRVGAPLGGFASIADQIGDPSGSNSIAQDIAAIQTSVNTGNADLSAIKGVGFATGTDSLKVVSDTLDLVKAKTDNLPADPASQSTTNTSITNATTSIKGVDNRDLTNITGSGWTATDNLHEIKLAVDTINTETDPAAIANAVWNELITSHQTANSMGRMLNDIFRVLKNKAVINATSKQLEVYDDAGASIIFTFDLKDENGVASATRIFRRLPL